MGGVGALNLGLSHPQIFGSVYAMSPAALDRDGLKASGLIAGKSLAAWNSVVEGWRLLKKGEQKRRFRDYVQVKLNRNSR
jgi:enterochelin esterase-like enzyme